MNIKNNIQKTVRILKQEGILSLAQKGINKAQIYRRRHTTNSSIKKQFTSLVDRKNVMDADWSNHPYEKSKLRKKPPYVVSWVMSPPSTGGGHQNIFRFIEYIDKLGYINKIYLYSRFDHMTVEQARQNVRSYCKAKNVEFYYFDKKAGDADIVFATGWETAYPVFNLKTEGHKMYFVQDFEPYFYPIGTDYILAENTYRFGFFGIAAGGFLERKLSHDYGMRTVHYDFGANKKIYKVINRNERKDIFFYARPVTERRGFDLGIMALEIFHKKMPNYTIHFAGWDVSEWDIPFPYINHGAVNISELPDIYNQCAAALVISLTNMSLLPLELLASGTIPVVNDGDNNVLVSNNKYIRYAHSSPEALADALVKTVTMKNLSVYADEAANSVPDDGWDIAGKVFASTLEKEVSGE